MKPISVSVDLEANAAYVQYRHVDDDEMAQLDVVRDAAGVRAIPAGEDDAHDPRVVVDVDGSGQLVGVELVGLDRETADLAQLYLASQGITSPANLAAVIAAVTAA